MSERNRGRVHLNERRVIRGIDYGREPGRLVTETFMGDYELPDAPENPEFASLFTPEQQCKIDVRFQAGIAKRERRDAFVKANARIASCDCHARFHKPRRPDRKQRALTAKLGSIAHRPGSR